MKILVFPEKLAMGAAAAGQAAAAIRRAVAERGRARIVAATGASQLEFLAALVTAPGVAWDKVEMFHLDEYVGIGPDHPASFRRYLLERLIGPAGIRTYHLLDGQKPPAEVCAEAGRLIREAPIDVAFVGIGENAHLAFNDPPADFDTEEPYLVVDLDEACRRQQVGEGWFPDLAAVPKKAISMSCRQVLKAREIVVVVPDARKARAVKACCEGPISPNAPASILRTHPKVTLYLDRPAAARLDETLSPVATSS